MIKLKSKNVIKYLFKLLTSAAIVIISTIIAFIKNNKTESFYPIFNLKKISGLICFVTFAGITAMFAYTDANPFVYFQF
ncbi:MAG: hypothetical protein LUG21_07245 [Clostridiales bacterium]|nr:hypothetical protein [Clostridiales bacterium]